MMNQTFTWEMVGHQLGQLFFDDTVDGRNAAPVDR